jgi:hypothetical protein
VPGGGQERSQVQVGQAEHRGLGWHPGPADVLGRGVLQQAVDDRGAVEPGDDVGELAVAVLAGYAQEVEGGAPGNLVLVHQDARGDADVAVGDEGLLQLGGLLPGGGGGDGQRAVGGQ